MWHVGSLGNKFHPHDDNSLSFFAGTLRQFAIGGGQFRVASRFLRAISERVISSTFVA
jgi:hypothetical protein